MDGNNETLIKRSEAIKFTGCYLASLDRFTKMNMLSKTKIKRRVYYKKEELINVTIHKLNSYRTDFKRFYYSRHIERLIRYHGKEEEWLNNIIKEKGYTI